MSSDNTNNLQENDCVKQQAKSRELSDESLSAVCGGKVPSKCQKVAKNRKKKQKCAAQTAKKAKV